MNIVYLILAITFLTIAHFIKIERQSQFIEIYEKAPKSALSKALSITFILNMIVPFKLGNIFRILYPGKYLKNGSSFSMATIVIDMVLDFFTITIVYLILLILGNSVIENIKLYFIVDLIIILVIIGWLIFNKEIKKIILKIVGIFNENLRLKLLKTVWYSTVSFGDMIKNINKFRLFLYTISSILFYIVSYLFLTKYLISININIDFINIFNMMYGGNNLLNQTLVVFYNNVGVDGLKWLLIYIIIPIILIYLFSYIYKITPNKRENTKQYIELFPHVNLHDRLIFLENYFYTDNGKYLENYLKINRDVAIIQDFSAGSNATTILCSKNDKTFYRKYSIGKDAEKLYNQVQWIESHKSMLELTDIENIYYKDDICCYDMPYFEGTVTCFNYVHTMPIEDSWKNIKDALNDIDRNLHTINKRKLEKNILNKYLDEKVLKNIKKISEAKYIKPLYKYEYIYINGEKYHNLQYFVKKYLNKEYLNEVFQNDYYSDIHGDFTIENIICLKEKNNREKSYYIIDPNTGNIHDSPYLDYAKLLQSIHGGYEFLMNTKSVQYCEDKVDFLYTKSNVYYKLFELVIEYLKNKFGESGLKSIFYHEIIHWLRLMPYKINTLGERALIFYAGLIIVANDVEKRFEK